MKLHDVSHDRNGYEQLAFFYEQNKDKVFDAIDLEISGWFDAFMAAPLGLALDALQSESNEVHVSPVTPGSKKVLQKNGFLSYYGEESIPDSYNTTIPYKKVKPTDGKYFIRYVQDYFVGRPELPSLSEGLAKKIAEGMLELFQNAVIHSQASRIYTCGQFFPHAHSIIFCLADNGIGFRKKFVQRFRKNISSSSAIRWAMEDGHTTKKNAPGGLGLGILKKFIQRNNGLIQIVSYKGFYQYNAYGDTIEQMDYSFPGTIVTVEFRTDDRRSYRLKSEI